MPSSRRLRMTSSTPRAGRRQTVIDGQLTGIDDTHIHAGADGVVEEYRVDRLAHRVVARKEKGHVGDAARDQGAGQFCLKAGRFDKLHGVVVVFIDARGNRENIGIEDNVVGLKSSSPTSRS